MEVNGLETCVFNPLPFVISADVHSGGTGMRKKVKKKVKELEYPRPPPEITKAKDALVAAFNCEDEDAQIAAHKTLREYVDKLGVRKLKDYERRR